MTFSDDIRQRNGTEPSRWCVEAYPDYLMILRVAEGVRRM